MTNQTLRVLLASVQSVLVNHHTFTWLLSQVGSLYCWFACLYLFISFHFWMNVFFILEISLRSLLSWHFTYFTGTGVRLYYTTMPLVGGLTQRPSQLTLLHVRLPPGFAANATVYRPTKVHKALYSHGVLILKISCRCSWHGLTMPHESLTSSDLFVHSWVYVWLRDFSDLNNLIYICSPSVYRHWCFMFQWE